MIDYSKSKIYKIICNTTGLVYFGSTTQLLCQRKAKHIDNFIKNGNTTSKFVLENNNYEMILVENYPCLNKEELHSRERFYIENNNCVNKYIPNRNIKEWYNDNKFTVNNNNKKYYLENKEKILKKQKEYNELNKKKISAKRDITIICECGGKYSDRHKTRHFKSKKHQDFILSNNNINAEKTTETQETISL